MSDIINKIWPKWETVEIIGQGGFGTVYKVKRNLNKGFSFAAVKVITIPSDKDEIKEMTSSGMDHVSIRKYYKEMVDNLSAEIEMMEKFKASNHIVHIEDYEIVENEDNLGWTVLIRMELLTNLKDYQDANKMDVNEIVKMGIHICNALEYCHKNNIIHRDIKPGNIFVSELGDFKLGDFGISREVEKTNATLSQKGTKSYMAPEMVKLDKYGRTVDIYALGLTMYEILNYGRMPFLPSYPNPFLPTDREEAMIKRLTGETFPDAINADNELNEIIRKACNYNASERYQSASEMKEALEKWLDNNQKVEAVELQNEEIIEDIVSTTEQEEDLTVGDNSQIPFISAQEIEENKMNEEPSSEEVDKDNTEEDNVSAKTHEEIKDDISNEQEAEEKTIGSHSSIPFTTMQNNQTDSDDNKEPEEDKSSKEVDVDHKNRKKSNNSSEKEKQKNNFGKIMFILLLLVALLIGFVSCNSSSGNDESYIIPSVVGLKEDEAKDKLEKYKLNVIIDTEFNENEEEGIVIKQSIEEGEKINSGDSITLIVSTKKQASVDKEENNNSNDKSENNNSDDKGDWSDYVEKLPSNINEKKYQIEKQVRYSYRDKSTTESTSSSLSGWKRYDTSSTYSDWGEWTDWGTTYVAETDVVDVYSKYFCEYHAVVCEICSKRYPEYMEMIDFSDVGLPCGHNDVTFNYLTDGILYSESNYKTVEGFNGFYSTTSVTPDNEMWFFHANDINSKAILKYRYRTRTKTTVYHYYKWGEWSDYSTTKVTANDKREVRTKTFYRYKAK